MSENSFDGRGLWEEKLTGRAKIHLHNLEIVKIVLSQYPSKSLPMQVIGKVHPSNTQVLKNERLIL